MIVGYDMFRAMVNHKDNKTRKVAEKDFLNPGELLRKTAMSCHISMKCIKSDLCLRFLPSGLPSEKRRK